MAGQQLRDEPPRDRNGSFYAPRDGGRVGGRHPGPVLRHSLDTRGVLHPLTAAAVVAGIGFAAASFIAGAYRR